MGNAPVSESMEDIAYPQSPDLLMWQMSPEDILNSVSNNLEGKIQMYNEKGKLEWYSAGEPIVNDEGRRELLRKLSMHLSKVLILTDMDEEKVKEMAKESTNDIIDLIWQNWKRWDMKKSVCTGIVHDFDHIIFGNLSRGMLGRTLDHQKPMIKRIETVQERKRGGMLSWIPGFGGGEG